MRRMSDVSGYFEFMIWRHLAYVRCNGQANMHNSHLFKDLTETLLARGYDRYVIDLERCETMDSTFMGVLVGMCERKVLLLSDDSNLAAVIAGLLKINRQPVEAAVMTSGNFSRESARFN